MVLLGRIELPTSALPRMRSTTELQQPTISYAGQGAKALSGRGALLAGPAGLVKHCPAAAMPFAMKDDPATLTREERLAAKLRENLRRRKAQSREMETREMQDGSADRGENAALPKEASKS